MTAKLVIFLLFILPFLVWPFGGLVSPFETPKVIAAEVAIEILILLFFLKINISSFLKNHKLQIYLVLGLIFLSLIHLIISPSPTSFFGNEFRLQGVFLLWHFLVFSLVSSNIEIKSIPNYIYPISLTVLLLVTIILGGNENGRAFGTLGEPNSLAATAIFFLPFLIFIHKKLIKISGFIVALIIIFLSGSRSGLIAYSLETVFILSTQIFKVSIIKTFSLSFILLILSLSLPLIEGGGWFENRSQIWQTSFLAGMKSPILGNGFGNIHDSIRMTSLSLNNTIQYQFVDSTHNIFLDFWVQGGILGLALFVLLLLFSIKNLITQSRTLELTVLLGLLAVMSFNPASVATLIAFWWIIGRGFILKDHSHPLPKGGI